MKIISYLTFFVIGLFFIHNSIAQTSNNYIIICNKIETEKLKDYSILLVSYSNNNLKINDGKALGLMPMGDKKIALVIDNSINDIITIEIEDINGKTNTSEVNISSLNCNPIPYSLENNIKSIVIKNYSQKAVFNFTEYLNSSK
jgi:hypothetical protein